MYIKSRYSLICFALLLSISGISHATEYVVDQSNDNGGAPPTFEGYTTGNSIIGQSFSPTAATLDHVELYVRAARLGFSSEVHIEIMDSPFGTVLGSSSSQIIDDQFIVRHFHLDSIDISGFTSLFIRVVEDFGNLATQVHAGLFLTGGFNVDDYAGGTAYAGGVQGGDFWFRTGSSTVHADTAEFATTAGHATTAGTAENLSSDLCVDGELLVKDNGDWICTDTAPKATTSDTATTAGHATTADSATTADTLGDNTCSDGEILIKENGVWACASRNTSNGAEYADVAGTLDPDLCGAGEVLLKNSNNEWSCSAIATPGIPFFTSGVAVRNTFSQGLSVYNTPNDASSCCFLAEDQSLAEAVLPRGGILSNLTVKPVELFDNISITNDSTIVEVTLLINGIPTDLSIDHDSNVDPHGAVVNNLDRVEVLPTDSISFRFTETGGTCFGYQRLDFMESGIEILKEAVTVITPLILKYDRTQDPEWWRVANEQNDLAEELRYIYAELEDEQSYYQYCGRYSVSFMLE